MLGKGNNIAVSRRGLKLGSISHIDNQSRGIEAADSKGQALSAEAVTVREPRRIHFDLADFRLFANIAEHASFTRGAERSCLSLPAASGRIKNLEQQLGLQLLERSPKNVSLTEAGKVYLRHAKDILSRLEILSADLQEFGTGVKGCLRIFANTTSISEFLPPVLQGFLYEHPEVQVSLREHTSEEIVRSVRDGLADIGVIAGEVVTHDVETVIFSTSDLVVIAPKGYFQEDVSSLSFDDVLSYDFVGLLDGSASQKFFQMRAFNLQLPFPVRVQVASWDSVCRMVAAGAGISIVPSMVVDRLQFWDKIDARDLAEDWAAREYRLCAKKFNELPRFAKEFAVSMVERYGSQPTCF